MLLKLGDDVLPFTNTAMHLGHFLDNFRSMIKKDMKTKFTTSHILDVNCGTSLVEKQFVLRTATMSVFVKCWVYQLTHTGTLFSLLQGVLM